MPYKYFQLEHHLVQWCFSLRFRVLEKSATFLILGVLTDLAVQFVRILCSSNMASSRWIKPEIYPLLAPLGFVVGLSCFSMARHISSNPEVRVKKVNRAAGVLENFEEGEKYKEHRLRQFLRGQSPEVMPTLNKFFADPK